jgi:hypothetical protein
MPTVLIACCPHDPPTVYGYLYLRKLLTPIFTKHGHKVIFLKTANLQNFRYALEKYDPDFVILNGHGGYKGVKGCNENVILGVKTYDPIFERKLLNQNPEWMQGRIVYLFTCNAGRELAQRLIEYGATAVAGYRSAFFFLSEDEVNPPTDKKAYPFFYSALQLPIKLAEGYAFSEACVATKKAFIFHTREAESERDELAAKYLYHNLTNFVAYGNMSAQLLKYVLPLYVDVER